MSCIGLIMDWKQTLACQVADGTQRLMSHRCSLMSSLMLPWEMSCLLKPLTQQRLQSCLSVCLMVDWSMTQAGGGILVDLGTLGPYIPDE